MNSILFLLLSLTQPVSDKAQPLAVTSANAPAAVITFKASAQVGGRTIKLGDIANVECQSEKQLRALESVEVGVAPVSAYPRTVSADYARIRIRAAGLETDRILFCGSSGTEVKRLDQTLSASAIEMSVRQAVEQAYPGQSSLIAAAPRELRLPVGKVELKPQVPPLTEGGTGAVLVQILVDGKGETSAAVTVRLLRKSPVLVAARDVPGGTTLSEADIQVEERAVMPGPVTLSDPAAAIGQLASQPVKAGMVLSPSVLRPAIVVKRGSRVVILSRGASFTISAAGEAIQDGSIGQSIRVRNANSQLELTGRVIGPDQVEVAH